MTASVGSINRRRGSLLVILDNLNVKKVMGKAKLLYKLAKAVTAQPECVVREVIYPVVCLTNDVLERFRCWSGLSFAGRPTLVPWCSCGRSRRPSDAFSSKILLQPA
jgi:hypothetical protein